MLAGLLQAIDELLEVDAQSLSDADLEAFAVEAIDMQSRLSAAVGHVLAEWDARRVWAADGPRSARAHLAHHANVSRAQAGVEVGRCRRLRHAPLVAEAFRRGEIGADRADLLGRVNGPELRSLFQRDEAILVEAARSLPWDDFETVVRRWKDHADDESGRDPSRQRHRDRRLSIVSTVFGTVDLAGHGPALEGAIVAQEVERLEAELFADDLAKARAEWGDDVALDKLARTAQQRRFDALVAMATRSASLPDGAPLARPLITVVMNHPRFADVCKLSHNLVDLHPHDVARLLDDFDIERIVFGPKGRIVDVGRRTRVFRGALRRGIEVRDLHCQLHPSCREPAERCDVDHIVEYEDGGETTQANGRLGCGPHNRWKHREKRKRQGRPPPGG